MKILFICHRFPYPPKRGGKIRPFHIIRHLGKQHDITVASLARSADEEEQSAGIASICSRYLISRVTPSVQFLRMVGRIPSAEPSSMGYFYSRSMAGQITSFLRQVPADLIMVHCSSMAQYVAHVSGIPKILDFGDMDSQKWLDYSRFRSFPLKLGYWMEGHKLLRREQLFSRQFDFCTTTTRAELETLREYRSCAEEKTDWFPNGVDDQYFQPQDPGDYDADKMVFLGRMDYYPNQECMIDFCRHTLPLVRARRPNAQLLIVGADPSVGIRNLGRIPGVTVTGSVPDVRPYLKRAALMVAPMNIARGTQNKILEAMATGIPVVASHLSAKGVDAVDGEHLLCASQPREYADAIDSILSDPARRISLSIAGRQRVLSHHNWESSAVRLDSIIERCMTDFRGRR